jgi:hypothetical protein
MSLNLALGPTNEIAKTVNGWDGGVSVSISLAERLGIPVCRLLRTRKKGSALDTLPSL